MDDIDKLLENYKPKSLKKYLSKYIYRKKLLNYTLLEDNNYDEIIPSETYIKYIYIDEAYCDKNLDSHIKSGGFFLRGGIYKGNKFIETDKSKWKYLLLKYDPSNNIYSNPVTYTICISKCYIFYKKIYRKRDYLKNIIIELI